MDAMPVLLVLGPSGAGKSTLGGFVQENLGLLHLELDGYAGEDAIDRKKLRHEWDEFYLRNLPGPFASALRRRAGEAGAKGAIATFPSPVVFTDIQLGAADAEAMTVVVLYGTEAECREAFLARESTLQRGLDVAYWQHHNAEPHARFSLPAYARRRVAAFSSGTRKSFASLLAEIEGRLAVHYG